MGWETASTVALGLVIVLGFAALPAAATTDQTETGTLLVGTTFIGLVNCQGIIGGDCAGYDGVSFTRFAVKPGTIGHPFTLKTTDPGPLGFADFDICFEDEDFNNLKCHSKAGGEAGTVPDKTAHAFVVLFFGADASFEYQATTP